jgi:hypothetical protein
MVFHLIVKVIMRGRTDVPHRTLSRKDPVIFAKKLLKSESKVLLSVNPKFTNLCMGYIPTLLTSNMRPHASE